MDMDPAKFDVIMFEAIQAADARLLKGAGDDSDVLEYLTITFIAKFLEKSEHMARLRMMRKLLQQEAPPNVQN